MVTSRATVNTVLLLVDCDMLVACGPITCCWLLNWLSLPAVSSLWLRLLMAVAVTGIYVGVFAA